MALPIFLIDRIFLGDRYNPFTHQIHIHSDLPSVALHELGHAYDFSYRRYKGSYAFARLLPFVDLYQEYVTTDQAFDYLTENRVAKKLYKTEIESYNVLHPAYSTYVGAYLGFLAPIAWIAGHIWGRSESEDYIRSGTGEKFPIWELHKAWSGRLQKSMSKVLLFSNSFLNLFSDN